jgi:hypothetical protein
MHKDIYGVHFAGLLDVQNILSPDTVVSPGKLKVIHLVSPEQRVSVTTSSLTEASIVLCSVSL